VQQELTNKQLIKALHQADEISFAYIYQQYHQAVFKNINKLIINQQEAEDILQEVFITLWQKKQELTEEHSVAGWLFTTSYYKSLEQLKKAVKLSIYELTEAHSELHTEPLEQLTNEVEYNQKVITLTIAIEQLPPQKKLAFKLCRLEGKTYEEIASILNISVDTAKEYVKSASKLLRQTVATHQLATTTFGLIALSIFLEN
jgi:RNA polymerase sigma-70 factor (ECF subfamily)